MFAAASGPAALLTAPNAGPNLRLGLRTTIASVLPLLGASLLQEPALIWMSLGGLYVNLADTGGAYRTKATAMASASLLGTLALGSGIILAAWPWWCVPAMFLVGLGCGLLSLYGNAGSLIGLVTAWCFLIGINVADPDLGKALAFSLLYLAGGAWATLLALAIWPLRPYGPVRMAIASTHREIARYLRLAWPASGTPAASEPQRFQQKLRVRNSLTSAESTLAATRSGRLGDSPADRAFTRLIESADELFLTSATLADRMAAIPPQESPQLRRRMETLRDHGLTALQQLDQALLGRARQPEIRGLEQEATQIAQALARLDPELSRSGASAHTALQQAQAAQARWIALLSQACATLPLASSRQRGAVPTHQPIRQIRVAVAQGWATLRANWTLDSIVLRHALRFGVASAVAVSVYTLFALPIGYWITLTVSVILRPSAGETLVRTNQRVLGTVLGGIVAIVLATLFPHPLTLVLLLVPITMAMMAMLPVNYGLFVFLLTPWIVLYKDIVQPGDWELALWRIGNTLIGASLSLVAIRLILPRWENETLPSQLADCLRCQARFLRAVLERIPGAGTAKGGPPPRELRLAIGNSQVSIQRYLSETGAHRPMALPLMAFLLHSQRLIDALVLLGSGPHPRTDIPGQSSFELVREQLLTALEALASAVERHERPDLLPELDPEQARALGFGPLIDPIQGLQRSVDAWCT